MQPSARPWQGWEHTRRDLLDRYQRRRVRLSLHELADLRDIRDIKIDWARLARPDIALLAPDQIRNLIRFDNNNGQSGQPLAFPTVDGPWREQPREPSAPWRLPDLPMESRGALGAARVSLWEGAARGLPVGAVLLALLVLLVRMAERCFDMNFFLKLRRRQSQEWTTPTVQATSHQYTNGNEEVSTRMDDSDGFQSETNNEPANDLPPPYYECANNSLSAVKVLANREEPPPPYSACYVAYTAPKDGTPSVHFFNSRRQSLFDNRLDNEHTTNNISDTGQVPTTSGSNGCDTNEGNLVFDNGRVIQRNADTVGNNNSPRFNDNATDGNVNVGNRYANDDDRVDVHRVRAAIRERFFLV